MRHGSAEGGGVGLSLTEWGNDEGLVVYWLQRPGGTIFVKTYDGYEQLDFQGTPSEFKSVVLSKMGRPVEIWFGDRNPENPPHNVTVVRDKTGNPSFALADHGDAVSISVLNVANEFAAIATIPYRAPTPRMPCRLTSPARL